MPDKANGLLDPIGRGSLYRADRQAVCCAEIGRFWDTPQVGRRTSLDLSHNSGPILLLVQNLRRRRGSGTESEAALAAQLGYARVSTRDQDPRPQHDALEAAGVTRIFTDVASGATQQRPELAACFDYLTADDTLVVWRLDRLGRSLRDLIGIVDDLRRRGVQFRSLTEGFDTPVPADRSFSTCSQPWLSSNATSSANAPMQASTPPASRAVPAAAPPS